MPMSTSEPPAWPLMNANRQNRRQRLWSLKAGATLFADACDSDHTRDDKATAAIDVKDAARVQHKCHSGIRRCFDATSNGACYPRDSKLSIPPPEAPKRIATAAEVTVPFGTIEAEAGRSVVMLLPLLHVSATASPIQQRKNRNSTRSDPLPLTCSARSGS
jgi:hypothetical protein